MDFKSKKSRDLGMHHGTAHNRMEKNMVFYLAQLLGKDFCYRCGSKITDVDDFTYDHIVDWQGKPNALELFIDPKNIAFSHYGCNSRFTSRRTQAYRISGFKGVYYCKSRRSEKKWQAQITYNRKKINAGYFLTPEEAAKAYDDKAIELFGKEAITNQKLGLFK